MELQSSDESYYCPTCSTARNCAKCHTLLEEDKTPNGVIRCQSSCDKRYHIKCVDISLEEAKTRNNASSYWECESCYIPPHVPDYESKEGDLARAKWNGLQGKELFDTINDIYHEITTWQRNLFKVPTGRAGQDFVSEVNLSLQHFATGTLLESISLKIAFILFPLLLQKPSKKSKAKDHTVYLQKRINLLRTGKIYEIVHEGRAIQKRLVSSKRTKPFDSDKVFAKLMLQGKVSAALRWVGSSKTSVRECDEETFELLKLLHPDPEDSTNASLLRGPIDKVESFIFDNIDAKLIQSCVKRISGAAGPSGADAELWLHILCTKQLKKKPLELCDTIAKCAKRMATSFIDPAHLEAFTACRLVPLNKSPSGVRPIGIGELLHRIIGKAIVQVINNDIVHATAPIQVCAGIPGGVEAAVHSLRSNRGCSPC